MIASVTPRTNVMGRGRENVLMGDYGQKTELFYEFFLITHDEVLVRDQALVNQKLIVDKINSCTKKSYPT